ncbi:STAS-like domain-containing protein [Vibrio sp. SCSIO 43136]|uniref:STAS-like domain-containing protein n=1 Tax=Vibrio sp. SCSIO 43136 TaxID=2819101 RepID=UPI002074D44C|nr:STAS-like domain-containing protein [Vibrio sp. SCSIO 43136]USD67157.1 STAS-like domain-containing protein [Vibrio sp. SCSIO 43136]
MTSTKTIVVTKDFHPRPKGRYIQDAPGCDLTSGEAFRNMLVKELKKHDSVVVDLTGYNRYGRSFLDEAFGGLISRNGFTKKQLDQKLTVKHDDLDAVVLVIEERITSAEARRKK